MKKVFALILCCAAYLGASAQCTPAAATGNPGFVPDFQTLACVDRGVAYSEVIQVENFTSIAAPPPIGNITVNSLRVDSVTNLPCGLTWQMNPGSNTLTTGQTGCILVSGTSTDFEGQYKLGIWITVNLPVLGNQSGEASALSGQFGGPDFSYYVRVKESVATCPTVDISGGATNLTASAVCPPIGQQFTAEITGPAGICSGGSATLTATTTPVMMGNSYLWSTGQTTDNISVSAAGTYTVTVTNTSGSEVDDFTITTLPDPTAGFTSSVTGSDVTFTSTSTDATSYSWDFGDGSGTSNMANPTYSYGAANTYTVSLTVNNDCGSDTFMDDVTTSVAAVCPLPALTGSASASPIPDAFGCVEQGVAFNDNIGIEVPATINVDLPPPIGTISATVNFIRIDSLGNLPCGIDYELNPANGLINGGSSACINFTGTTDDAPGQYKTQLYVTVSASAVGQTIEQGGEISDLIGQLAGAGVTLPFDLEYYFRVHAPGTTCLPLDRSPNAENLSSPNALFEFTDNGGGSYDFTSNVSASTSVSWNFDDGTTDTTANPTHIFEPGVYNVVLTVTNSCGTVSNSQSIDFTSSIADRYTTNMAIGVQPNPNTGSFTVTIDGAATAQECQLAVIGMDGKVVYSRDLEVNSGSNAIPVQLGSLASGVYFVRLQTATGAGVKKLIIK